MRTTAVAALTGLTLLACKSNASENARPEPGPAARDGSQTVDPQSGSTPMPMRDAALTAPDDSTPEVLYPLQGANIGHVYVDDTLLWYEHGDYVFQAPKAGGGTPTQLGAVRGGASTRFVADADAIYWLNGDRIERMPKQGGERESWPLGRSFEFGGWLFVDEYVYLLDGVAAAIWRCPRGGGHAERFASGLNTAGDKGGGVTLSAAGRVLYASYLSDVWAISLDSSTVTHVSPTQVSNASQVAVIDDYRYFIDGRHDTGGTLYRFRSGETAQPLQAEPNSLNVAFLLPDGARNKLYWIASTIGPIVEFDISQGSMSTLTGKQTSNGIPASDADYIYWARNSHDPPPAIMRLKKR